MISDKLPVAFIMSSPTFFGERPNGPIFGAREEVAAISPPTHLNITEKNIPMIKLYETHLGCKTGDLDKPWAPNIWYA
ncbi:hypothetical protein Avbf_10881 [Armadillidium vulgare]|nr:hypothetical protein Avbf_10881 [Armadillidium vulgare]